MAIPIKCPGCQAAFEVPESLGGKTIRCTSCKTQLPVPALAVAAAPKAKLATAAARPAPSKPSVKLDDEAKSKPTRSSSDSGAKTSKMASKRRDDDDDDDEEEEKRPAKKSGKKKAKEAGKGGMIALIAGAAIGLCRQDSPAHRAGHEG